MEDIRVTVATDQEARACLALLPEAQNRAVELLIARAGGALVGAAAIYWQSWSTPAGFPIAIQVIPEARRRGVATRLLAVAADLAAEETDGLWPFKPVDEEDPAARFMLAVGFRPYLRQLSFRGTVEALLGNISPLAARLRSRDGIAERIELGRIGAQHFETLGWLVSSELGGGPFSAAERMRVMSAAPDSMDRSQVAVVDGQLAGAILWRLVDGEAMVDARVVAPRWRAGPINLLLLEAGLLQCRAEGVTHIRFHCDDTVKDTISLARRAQAVQTDVKATFYYPFDDGG